MNPLIMNIFAIVLVVCLILAWIPWRKIGESIFANNPTKGLLYIEIGEDTDCVSCKYAYSNEKGSFYFYKWRGILQTVAVPKGYGYKWLHGRRMIRLGHAGDAWAAYWATYSVPDDVQKSAFDLNAMIRGNVGVELVRTIFGAKKMNWLLILIIVGAVLVGYYFYRQGQVESVPEPAPAQQQQITEGVPHA